MNYSKDQIKKAIKMRKQGKKFHEILAETGVPHTVIYWHGDQKKRVEQTKRIRKWQSEHPEQWKKMMLKAQIKFQKKKNG